MSTKIYEGRKVELHHGFRDIHAWTMDLKQKLQKARLDAFVTLCPTRKLQSELFAYWISNPNLRSLRSMPDFGAEVVWFPDTIHTQLLIPFFHQRAYDAILDAMPGVSEYAYWNNSDKPEHVTDEEWDDRASVWNAVLPGAGVPSECGYSIRLLPEGIPMPIECVGEHDD